MSSNGEIEVAVKAEGVDDAAAEMGEAGDGGGGGGSSTLSDALKGGLVGGLLSQAIRPLLDVLDPMLKILQAFLAPVAVMLMRLFMPVLRLLLPLLPAWFDFIDRLPGMIDNAIAWIAALPGRIWDFMTKLPGMIWDAIKNGVGWLTSLPSKIAEWLTGVGVNILGDAAGAAASAASDNDLLGGFLEGAFGAPQEAFDIADAFLNSGNSGGGPGNVAVNVQTDQDDWITAEVRDANNPSG